MRIGIFVYLIPEGKSGGVQQYSQQLVYALGKYSDLQIKVFCSKTNKHLFEGYKGDNVSIIVLPSRCKYLRFVLNNRYIRASKYLTKVVEKLSQNSIFQNVLAFLGDYRRFIEENVDVIHFPYQVLDRYDFKIPTIISLHDLQHKYFPEFFSQSDIQKREIYFKRSAEVCTRIMVSFSHVKEDIVKFYKINPDKIDICGLGYDSKKLDDSVSFQQVQKKYEIPNEYLLYPAVTWRHKNHIRLINAIRVLQNKFNKKIKLICTGQKNEFYTEIEKEIKKLGLKEDVLFTGFLQEGDFEVLLKNAKLVVIPTLYEAESIPLIEAMAFGTPVICSNVTVLPEQIGDKRFIFDPYNSENIADKINELISNPILLKENIQNGVKQIGNIKWEKKINNFVESYKKSLN
jgi:glycosyltransferase involved in cell wall biosynthesis